MKGPIVILLLKILIGSINAGATTYYFSSTDGDDSRTSSQAQDSSTPWRSIDKLNSVFTSLRAGDFILFKRGDVFYGSISIKKSGSSKASISFDAYGKGVKPVITGFTDVTAWTSIGDNLWVSANAVSNLFTLNMVTVNGQFVPIGKWPNSGYNTINASSGGTSLTSNSLTDNWVGGTVVIRKNHWILDKSTIIHQSGNTIDFTSPTNYSSQNGWGFFIQNIKEACDIQNEWWYSASKKIGIYSSSTPAGVSVATVDNLVDISSYSFINFNNITFQGSNSATVIISSGNNIDFENCDFLFQGMNGFTVESAAHHITVNNCTSNYTNNDFISGGGSSNWKLTNNIITNTGQVPGMGNSADGNYIAIYNVGASSLIQYNVIKKTGYSGIDFRGPGISVLNNLVDTFCNVKDDGGGIYTFTGSTPVIYSQRLVSNNIVLNGGGASEGTNTAHADAYGIYMDGLSSNVTVNGNTVANCGSSGIFLHEASDISVTNNTLYNNMRTIPATYGQIYIQGSSAHNPTRNLTITGNKFVSRENDQLVATFTADQNDLNLFGTFNDNYYCRPINDNSTIVLNSPGNQITNLEGWKSSFKQDGSSKKSPKTISNTRDLRFEYNATSSDKSIKLSATFMDVTGKRYTGSITLSPYSSAVLIYVSGNPLSNANEKGESMVGSILLQMGLSLLVAGQKSQARKR
jgi:parallel beta-helix repeat protein